MPQPTTKIFNYCYCLDSFVYLFTLSMTNFIYFLSSICMVSFEYSLQRWLKIFIIFVGGTAWECSEGHCVCVIFVLNGEVSEPSLKEEVRHILTV